MHILLFRIAAVTALFFQQSFALTVTGRTILLNNIPYYLPAQPAAHFPSSSARNPLLNTTRATGTLIPFLAISTDDNNTSIRSASDLERIIARYRDSDDVFNDHFLKGLYIQGANWDYEALNTTSIRMSHPSDNPEIRVNLPPGPYVLSPEGEVYEPWRLYSDFAGAFTESIMADGHGTYGVLPVGLPGRSLAIAVPSRLYFTKTAEKPLAGVRLGIKDIYDIAGVKTGCGSRAWYNLYPAAKQHSTPVQRLIDAGAVIVGKMATSQFANGEDATGDWVDHPAPFNPRGDGYQLPQSSSAGGGAGAASYPWLDLALGSDTGGSVRGPAQVQGLYGNRPTHDLVSLENTMPLAPELDTAGFLTKDPILWGAAAKVLYGENITISHEYPTHIKTFGISSNASSPEERLIADFIGNVSDFLGASVSRFDLENVWKATRPANISSPLDQMLNLTYPILITKQQTRLLRDPFYKDYAAAHDGRRPFVDPAPLVRWAFGDSYPSDQTEEENAKRDIFADWVQKVILSPNNQTCSDSLLFYVGSSSVVNYRNQYSGEPKPPMGFSIDYMSPFWGGPDFVVPVGSKNYFSEITLHDEYLPVTVDIVAAKGCDGMIYGLVQDLVAAGILKPSMAGYSNTVGGEVLFRRGE